MNPLTIYPKHPDAPDMYHIGGAWTPACITAVEKRFTDTELAAEYWASHGEDNATITGNRRLTFTRRQALRRFATLPHYDEDYA